MFQTHKKSLLWLGIHNSVNYTSVTDYGQGMPSGMTTKFCVQWFQLLHMSMLPLVIPFPEVHTLFFYVESFTSTPCTGVMPQPPWCVHKENLPPMRFRSHPRSLVSSTTLSLLSLSLVSLPDSSWTSAQLLATRCGSQLRELPVTRGEVPHLLQIDLTAPCPLAFGEMV